MRERTRVYGGMVDNIQTGIQDLVCPFRHSFPPYSLPDVDRAAFAAHRSLRRLLWGEYAAVFHGSVSFFCFFLTLSAEPCDSFIRWVVPTLTMRRNPRMMRTACPIPASSLLGVPSWMLSPDLSLRTKPTHPAARCAAGAEHPHSPHLRRHPRHQLPSCPRRRL